MRCNKCQRFGHIESNCTNQLKCCRCGQTHTRTECENIEKPKYLNCSGTVYRFCPKYNEMKEALKIRTVQQDPLKEALRRVKEHQKAKKDDKKYKSKTKKAGKPKNTPEVDLAQQELPVEKRQLAGSSRSINGHISIRGKETA